MSDIDVETLSCYDITIEKTYRGRGAIICEGKGEKYKLLPYNRTKYRLEFVNELSKQIKENGFPYVEEVEFNKEGELVTTNEYQESYIVKKTFIGNECDIKNKKNVIGVMETMAELHKCMRGIKVSGNDGNTERIMAPETPNMLMEYDRHIREIKRINTYLRGRKNKTEFEYSALLHIDEYYNKAKEAYAELYDSSYKYLEKKCRENGVCVHGNFSYHNVIQIGDKYAIVGFDRAGIGCQIKDMHYFIRKVMEKHNWNEELFNAMINRYNSVRKLEKDEVDILIVMLGFPEKFWKVLNQYYNSNKTWIPERNIEKLNMLYMQEEKKGMVLKNFKLYF